MADDEAGVIVHAEEIERHPHSFQVARLGGGKQRAKDSGHILGIAAAEEGDRGTSG